MEAKKKLQLFQKFFLARFQHKAVKQIIDFLLFLFLHIYIYI